MAGGFPKLFVLIAITLFCFKQPELAPLPAYRLDSRSMKTRHKLFSANALLPLSVAAFLLASASAGLAQGRPIVSQDDLLTKGRPAGLFIFEEGQSDVCKVLKEKLNAPHQASLDSDPNDVLLHTGLEVTWRTDKYRTTQGKAVEIFVTDVTTTTGAERYLLFNERSWFDIFPHEYLYYVPPEEADAARDKDSILSTEFIKIHINSNSSAGGIVSVGSYITRMYGTVGSDVKVEYVPGNRLTANAVTVNGGTYVILGPVHFFDPHGVLKRGLSVFVVGIPQDPTHEICRFST